MKTWRKLERLLTVVTYKLMVKIKLLKRLLNRACILNFPLNIMRELISLKVIHRVSKRH